METLTKQLDKYKKQLESLSKISPAIYISNESRFDSSISNSELAQIHNYGSLLRNIPARPFCTPEVFNRHIDEISDFLYNIIKEKDQNIELYKKLSDYMYSIVMKQFDTNGEGRWKPVKLTSENTHILQKTYQLRNSIKSRVVIK